MPDLSRLQWTNLVVREHHDDLTGDIMHDVSITIQLCSYQRHYVWVVTELSVDVYLVLRKVLILDGVACDPLNRIPLAIPSVLHELDRAEPSISDVTDHFIPDTFYLNRGFETKTAHFL